MFKKISTLLLGALLVFVLAACGSDTSDDKAVYEKEVKPQLDAMMKEYDDIWNQEWKPLWAEISTNPKATNPNELKTKMDSVSTKYDALSKKVVDFKGEDKISDADLKEKITNFKNEFVLSVGYRGNAAKAVKQGLDGVAPMRDRMEESKKSIELADKKLTSAVGSLGTVESTLGVKR
ncbi:ribonuclease [Bacillus cereus]|uniref:ribonuclease n=1 Tax=Bacillus cereus TaxID=1396 RepID=UPI0030160384